MYMRRIHTCAAVLLLLVGAFRPFQAVSHASAQARQRGRASARAVGWEAVPAILARIRPPKFPARDFLITSYGAAGDGKADSTEAIRKAVEACKIGRASVGKECRS